MKISSFFKKKKKSQGQYENSSHDNTPTTPTTTTTTTTNTSTGLSRSSPQNQSSPSILMGSSSRSSRRQHSRDQHTSSSTSVSNVKSTSEAYPNSKIFGFPLPEDVNDIPKFVYQSITYLTQYGLTEEGLFRVSTSKDCLDKVISELEHDINLDVNFDKYGVHLAAALLKIYFRELSDPLLTFDCYGMFIAAERIPDEGARLETIKKVVKFLPPNYYTTLKMLCEFLHLVSQNSKSNKMTADNLAIVFAPNILRERGELDVMDLMRHAKWINHLTKTLIENTDYIFGMGSPRRSVTSTSSTPSNKNPTTNASVDQSSSLLTSNSTTSTTTNNSTNDNSNDNAEDNSKLIMELAQIRQTLESNDEHERMLRRRQTLERRTFLSSTERKKTIAKMTQHNLLESISNTNNNQDKDSSNSPATPGPNSPSTILNHETTNTPFEEIVTSSLPVALSPTRKPQMTSTTHAGDTSPRVIHEQTSTVVTATSPTTAKTIVTSSNSQSSKSTSSPTIVTTSSATTTTPTKKPLTTVVKKNKDSSLITEFKKAVQKYLCSSNLFGIDVDIQLSQETNTVLVTLSGLIIGDTSCDIIETVTRLGKVSYFDPLDSVFNDIVPKLAKHLSRDFKVKVQFDNLHEYDLMLDECPEIMLITCLHSIAKYFFEYCDDPKLDDQFFVDWILTIFPTMTYYPYYHMILYCLLIRQCYKEKDFDKLSNILKTSDQHPFSRDKISLIHHHIEDEKPLNYEKRAFLISKLMGGKNPFFTNYNKQLEFAKHFGFIITEVLMRDCASENPLTLFERFTLQTDIASIARVRTFDQNNESVLFDAIRVPDLAIMEFLVEECQVDVNAVNNDGISPLTLVRILYNGMEKEELEDYLTFVGAKEIKPQSIDILTHDMWRHIFTFLELKEIATWCRVSKNFYGLNVIDNEKLWMDIFQRIQTVETVAFNPFLKLTQILQTRECRISFRCLAEFKFEFRSEDITYFVFNEKDKKHMEILNTNTVLMVNPPKIESSHFISLLQFVFGECNLDDSIIAMYDRIKATKKSEKSMLKFIEEQIPHQHVTQLTKFVYTMQNIAVKREMFKDRVASSSILYYSVMVDNYWFVMAYNTRHKFIGVIIVASDNQIE
ncbi:hypothetical protein C9374_009712 [Naegleria lovaniensis]|uniref:Rho GTPase activating protein n=1 Tax=Naegleria lovaniensis TaxID=51637 RepID=A0AA88H1P3_NAELO|nr:uncharacterized protein C9374_009712 [Naegleria lovaniensis]KAG2393135.1 hypothetical protein C9374_009712 [Naegleria lovaniensis]